jgi:hypothetical protein
MPAMANHQRLGLAQQAQIVDIIASDAAGADREPANGR